MTGSDAKDLEEIHGYVDAIVYSVPENGFTVARIKENKKKELTVVVGTLPSLQPGETISAQGQWKLHPTHGWQFDVKDYSIDLPSEVVAIQKYLESGLVHGIGPVFAKKIVDRFKEQTLQVIDTSPDRLLEIEGLGEKKLQSVKESWQSQKTIRDVMIFLRGHGVSPSFAQRVYKAYGDKSVAVIRENPYRLAKEIFGIGFKLADAVALKLGFAMQSSERIRAGIEHILWDQTNQGHTCFPRAELVLLAQPALEVDSALIEKEVDALIETRSIVAEEGMLWLKPLYAYETGIASHMQRLLRHPQAVRAIDAKKAADWVETQLRLEFAPEQKTAIIQALTDKVHIITGGPGTGKSTITNAILRVSDKLTSQIILAAPTGRAAKRLKQITHRNALTIHALLEMDFASGQFKRGKENPLSCDLLIVDEASMIDTQLMFALLSAVPSGARVLLVGDVDQLPSVGPGMVLYDLIHSGKVPVTRLKEIFRQAKGSKIITNAHRINQGEFPFLDTDAKSDFHFVEAETPEAAQQVILQLVQKEIPEAWGLDPFDDIQVLAPMKKGIIGIELLNEALQTLLNPSSRPLLRGGKRFHSGDKVMQIANDYDKKVFNGDIGRIAEINGPEQTLVVLFDEKEVSYHFSELDTLVLAYATSIHKYQGSECPCVVLPIHTAHFIMLHRNLFYTAVTRGKKQVYLVGSKKAVAIAVQNNEVKKRHTGLLKKLSS
ncbi:MAG: uncharacterized protein RL235_8 [Chlamydiota bacterium]